MLWDLYEHGITQSLLKRWLVCRERFRLHAMCGLREDEGFDKKIEFGNILHAALECYATNPNDKKAVRDAILSERDRLRRAFPTSRDDINFWCQIAHFHFDAYRTRWQAEDKRRKFIAQEEEFSIAYKLPGSGRVVPLRGKWDALFTETAPATRSRPSKKKKPTKKRTTSELWLQENKCKGWIDEHSLQTTLHFDLQNMVYLVALAHKHPTRKIGGVLYNVIRRPLAEKHAIRQKKSESRIEFMERLESLVRDNPSDYFMRWKVCITKKEVNEFRDMCLNPMLEQLCDWYDWVAQDPEDPFREGNTTHFVRPFGVFDSADWGVKGDFFNLLTTGSMAGLVETNDNFPELG